MRLDPYSYGWVCCMIGTLGCSHRDLCCNNGSLGIPHGDLCYTNDKMYCVMNMLLDGF